MKDYLQLVNITIKNCWIKIGYFFVCFWSSFKKTFKKPIPYFIFSLFICSIVCSEIAYSRNSINLAYGFANYCQDTIISQQYDVVTFESNIIEPNDSKNFNRYSFACRNINKTYYQQAVAFNKASNEDGTDLLFRITSTSNAHTLQNVSLGTFFDYRGENLNSDYLATIRLEKMDKSNDNIDWLNFPFEGKDASSYIPLSLATEIVSNSNGIYNDVLDLIGTYYCLELGEKKYNLSINNIYRTDSYLGPYFKASVGEPIITDLKTIFSEHYSKLIIGSCSDAISIVGIQNYLGTIFEDGDDYKLSLCSVDGRKKEIMTPYDFNEAIKEMSSKSMSNPLKTIFLFLTLIIIISEIIICYWVHRKYKYKVFDFIPTIVFEEIFFLIVYVCFYITLKSTIRVYIWCNLFTMIIGILSPVLISFVIKAICRRDIDD